jgi:hypothetical protein
LRLGWFLLVKNKEILIGRKIKFKPSLYDIDACESLMEALDEVDVNVGQFWYQPIIEMLSYFELPDKHCSECHKKMPFMDYYIKQGMCDECASKFSSDDES